MNLSEHFTLEEFTRSDYAIRNNIENIPTDEHIENMRHLCVNVLENLRYIVKKPIHILSGFRNEELNRAIGGAVKPLSQHCEGKAADIVVYGYSVAELFELVDKHINYSQLIDEFGGKWLHVSFDAKEIPCRKSKLWATKENGKTIYTKTNPNIEIANA